MITDGFAYIAVLIAAAAAMVFLPKIFTGKKAGVFFSFVPPVVLIYLLMMTLCTLGVWSLPDTAPTYSAIKNPVLYAMVFLMLLRCDLRKIVQLGGRMLVGFFSAAVTIIIGFIASHAIFGSTLGENSWKSMGALCGSWLGGGGNMLAVQAALDVSEGDMAYALVMDSICATLYVMFLLWAVGFGKIFNKWTRADTTALEQVGQALGTQQSEKNPLSYQDLLLLLGLGFGVSALSSYIGKVLGELLPLFDASTWTVFVVTVLGVAAALTPLGKLHGTEELSNVMLYITIALIASRADLGAVAQAHLWLFAGITVLVIHAALMTLLAKIFHLDIFTCCVSSLANIGGTATAPVLAGSYNSALVPVGVVMALLGYIVGTGGGILAAKIMSVM